MKKQTNSSILNKRGDPRSSLEYEIQDDFGGLGFEAEAQQQQIYMTIGERHGYESIVDDDEKGPFNLPRHQLGLSKVSQKEKRRNFKFFAKFAPFVFIDLIP